MSIARKSILVAGLGRYGPATSSSVNIEKAQADLSKAKMNGFDCSLSEVNPDDVSGTLAMVKETLRSKQWDGFVIGYGVRGLKEYTVLFEEIVNAAREITPGTKLIFSNAPDGVFEAIRRAFPDAIEK